MGSKSINRPFVMIPYTDDVIVSMTYAYLYFHVGHISKDISFTLYSIIDNFGYCSSNNVVSKYANFFKSAIDLINKKEIYNYKTKPPSKINDLAILDFNEKKYKKIANDGNFIKLYYDEYEKIRKFFSDSGSKNKLKSEISFDIFLFIKELMFKNKDRDYCYITINNLSNKLQYDRRTLNKYLSILEETKSVYKYSIDGYKELYEFKDKYSHVISLVPLTKEQIIKYMNNDLKK